MPSSTFYLKYRPQKLEELDNREVAERIAAFLKEGHPPHAFLLVGHKGTGKTSSARIIAKIVNCENNLFAGKKSLEPCDKCPSCEAILKGVHPDVIEIDAASNTSVDDVRIIRDQVKLSSSFGRFKVYIIDEVHMISKSAFNALLKTLEEPPANTIFILATTEFEKVPATITSRSMIINFPRASNETLFHSLKRVVDGEKIKISDEALQLLTFSASGSFRDAAKILEEAVVMSKDREVKPETISKIFASTNFEDCGLFLSLLAAGEEEKMITMVENLAEKSLDLMLFVKNCLIFMHNVLLGTCGIDDIPEIVKKQLNLWTREEAAQVILNLEQAVSYMKKTDLPEAVLEAQIISFLREKTANKENPKIKVEISTPETMVKNENKTSLEFDLVSAVNAESKPLAGILRSCKIKMGEETVNIEAPSRFHFERLKEEKNFFLLENALHNFAGKNVKIELICRK